MTGKRRRYFKAKMSLTPIYQKPRTTVPHPEHRAYKYLLRGLTIERPNQVGVGSNQSIRSTGGARKGDKLKGPQLRHQLG